MTTMLRIRKAKLQFMSADHQVLGAIAQLQQRGAADIYGFLISQEIEQATGHIIGYGTLYRALSRLEHRGILRSRWEVPKPDEGRPRRRYYSLV